MTGEAYRSSIYFPLDFFFPTFQCLRFVQPSTTVGTIHPNPHPHPLSLPCPCHNPMPASAPTAAGPSCHAVAPPLPRASCLPAVAAAPCGHTLPLLPASLPALPCLRRGRRPRASPLWCAAGTGWRGSLC